MIRRTRSQSLVIWHQIANGLLYSLGKREPGELSDWNIPTQEYYEAIDYLTQVAAEILCADESSSQKRSRLLLKALQLDGKNNEDEPSLRKTLEILDDFTDLGEKASVETRANLARTLISSTALLDEQKRSVEERSDIEVTRQLRELEKRMSQHKK